MWRVCLLLLLVLLLPSCAFLPRTSGPITCSSPPIALLSATPGERVPSDVRSVTVIVRLRRQLDFGALAEAWRRDPVARRQRAQCVNTALERIAFRNNDLREFLKELADAGTVSSWRELRVENAFIATGAPSIIHALERRSEVASVRRIISEQPEHARELRPPNAPTQLRPDWTVRAIRADHAWKGGNRGQGVVVGIIDAGASAAHEQLASNFRGGPNSWFDPVHGTATPRDVQVSHGTGVLAAAVGQSTTEASGVAPASHWIVAIGRQPGEFHLGNFLVAVDWMLRVGRPDVLVLPLQQLQSQCDRSLARALNALRGAGMVLVFSAGNEGPGASTDVAPANLRGLFPDGAPALSVGATDANDVIWEGSSRGPNSCAASVFPQVVAPGEAVPVAFPLAKNMYRRADGTSIAAGVAAGAAALLISAFPEAQAEEIEAALRESARDLGPHGPDSTYGHGIIDVRAAMSLLQQHR